MHKALKIIVGIQVVLGTIWTLSLMTVERTSWANVYLFFYTYPFHFIFFLVGAWAFFRHRNLRRLAAWVMALPIGLLFLPGLIRGIAGGPVGADSAARLMFVLGILALIFAAVRPKQVTKWVPDFFYQSRGWNGFVVLLQLIGWATPFLLVAAVASDGSSSSSGSSPGMGVAVLFLMAATYFIGVGIFSLLTSMHAWLGLRGGVENASRGLHITQLVLGIPGILLGVAVIGWVVDQQ